MPVAGKALVSSYLALPFQSRSAQSPPGAAGPGSAGPRHPVPPTAHVPTRPSPGRGKFRSRGFPRPRLHLQRATSTVEPSTAEDLATPDTRPGTGRYLATVATNRPNLAVNLATPNTPRLDTDTEFLAPDARPGAAKRGLVTDRVIPDLGRLGKATATAGTAKPRTMTGATAMDLAARDPVRSGTAGLDRVLALERAHPARLDTSSRGTAAGSGVPAALDPDVGKTTPDSVINLTTSDTATYPWTSSGSTDPGLDHSTADAARDLPRETKGLPDTRTDAAMSELVPEPRPKPAVPMKPVSINSNLLGYIGIDTIIEQMRKKTMKTGFDFNIMVVGQSGLGKSTLVNTLFKSQVSRKASSWNREEKIPKTVEIKAIGHVIEEGGVKMKLTVIDTPGFGDQINNENCWEPIEKYINEQYEKFLKEEVNIARKKRIPDTRVHCCLYFISPTGHSLRPLDLEFMKHLSKVVNIIPVIAKADTMTLEEKSEFKQRVRKELEVNGIEFYPQKEFDEDLEDKTENDKIRESMPFAVVGSDKEYQVNGKRVLGRKTPWGIIEVENLNHCEFALLRDFVIRTHLQDLKEVTHNIHYETYRAKRLNDNGGLPPGEGLLGSVLPPVPATPCPTAE
ncbi:neuronal-specific septin-3 isoform 2-T2 [Glossophaga mutica]